MTARRAGHLLPTLALACAAASGWAPVPTAVVLVAASMGLRGTGPRVALAASVAALALAAAALAVAASGAPLDVAPETLVGLRRLLDAYGVPGAAAALATHPVRAVAAVASGVEAWGVAAGVAVRCAALVALGAGLARVPRSAWRGLGWSTGAALVVFAVAALAVRL